MHVFLLGLLFLNLFGLIGGSCSSLNYCSGHGRCGKDNKCICYEGWGSEKDFTTYRAPDCSARTCPSARSWADLPLPNREAHQLEECSGKGTCNRATGTCQCHTGFAGDACQRSNCPNDCSGHGRCMSMRRLAQYSSAMPLANNTQYTSSNTTNAWDSDHIFGCLCDSKWRVGLQANETQESEFFGPDCSQRHCPSGDDPTTVIDETDCFNVTAAGSQMTGKRENRCHVDCSNQGLCDHSTGVCKCFQNHWGLNCGHSNHVRAKDYNQEGIYFNDVIVDAIAEDHFSLSEEGDYLPEYETGITVQEGY